MNKLLYYLQISYLIILTSCNPKKNNIDIVGTWKIQILNNFKCFDCSEIIFDEENVYLNNHKFKWKKNKDSIIFDIKRINDSSFLLEEKYFIETEKDTMKLITSDKKKIVLYKSR